MLQSTAATATAEFDLVEIVVIVVNRYTRPEGGTAFFDALGEAFRVHTTPEAKGTPTDKWIVALTVCSSHSA